MSDNRLKKYIDRDINYHPIVKETLKAVASSSMSDADIAARAGVGRHYLIEMRRGRIPSPRLADLEAVLNVLGYKVEVRK